MQDPALVAETRDHVCKQDDDSQCGDITRSMDDLPEDICRRIHALLPLRYAARMACVSHTFLRSWRCHPNLTLSELTLGLNVDIMGKDEMTRDLINKVDHILKNHSDGGLKKLELDLVECNKVDACCVDSWLHIAVTAGVEEVTLFLPHIPDEVYSFPCTLLFNGSKSSIRYLHIAICAFRPTAGLGCWRSLTRLGLGNVLIADDELECLLSNCFALERLRLVNCREIVTLKIPCVLQRLRFLNVHLCRNLQVIDSNAPNISAFHFSGSLVLISFGSALQIKDVNMECLEYDQSNIVWHARTKLLSYAPNVEILSIASRNEVYSESLVEHRLAIRILQLSVDIPYNIINLDIFMQMISTPMLPRKFFHLKYLHISLLDKDEAISPAYDYLSLVSFLEASPCLETFIFKVRQPDMKHDSVIGDSSHLRRLPQHRHGSLKSVAVVGFCSAKSLVELVCHIIENATSLERLKLDTSYGCQSSRGCTVDEPQKLYHSVSGDLIVAKPDICVPMGRDILMEVPRALLAIRTHIEGKVPPRVLLQVVEPCGRCHAAELLDA